MDAFIDDGYSQSVGIDAVEGVHPELRFKYRPFTGNDALETYRKMVAGPTASNPKKAAKAQHDAGLRTRIAKEQSAEAIKSRLFGILLERVESWELDRPLNVENLNKLRSQLFQRMKDVVFGDAPPDFLVGEDGERIDPDDAEDDDAGN